MDRHDRGNRKRRNDAVQTMQWALMQWAMMKDKEKQKLENKVAYEEAKIEQAKLALEKRKQDMEWWKEKLKLQADKEKEVADYKNTISDKDTADVNKRKDYLAQQKAISDERAATEDRRRKLADERKKAKTKIPGYIKVKVGDKNMWGKKTPQGIVITDKEADKGGISIDIQGAREDRAKKDQEMQEESVEQKRLNAITKTEETIIANKNDPAVLPHITMWQKFASDAPYTYIYEKKPKTIFGLNAGFSEGVKRIDLPKRVNGEQMTAKDILDTLEMNRGKKVQLPNSTTEITLNTYEDILRYVGSIK